MLTPPSLSFFLQRLSNVDIGGHLSGSATVHVTLAMGVHIPVDNRHLYMSVVKSLLYSLRLSKHNLLKCKRIIQDGCLQHTLFSTFKLWLSTRVSCKGVTSVHGEVATANISASKENIVEKTRRMEDSTRTKKVV